MAGEGEFAFISRALAPLASACPGAAGLTDDGAVLSPAQGCSFAMTSDTLVSGVHFPTDADPSDVGWKALAVNVSDLVAMGAAPKAYLLNVVWPRPFDTARADSFVEGLRQAQDAFGCSLAGGDTTRADGPWSISITALGEVDGARTPRRSGARSADRLVVTNTIGDAWLGLQVSQSRIVLPESDKHAPLLRALHRPRPPVEIAGVLQIFASAAIDVSDGLLADATHILDASGLAGVIELDAIPLGAKAKGWVEASSDPTAARLALATGGDDYQILAAIPQALLEDFQAECRAYGHSSSVIGRLEAGKGLTVTDRGEPVTLSRRGFTHF